MSSDPAVLRETAPASHDEPDVETPVHVGTSLRDRLAARKQELEERTTEMFPVPRYDSILAVELKAIAWRDTEKIALRNARSTTDDASLWSAADEIVAATVGFHEIKDDGSLERIEDATSWRRVAGGLVSLPSPIPPKTAERTALIQLCSDQGVIALNTSYRRWLGGANTGIGEELKGDFRRTP